MSTDRFFDDLARTLASPMPRRRAVRVIGASLVAIALPGISPPRARAFSDECETRSGRLGSFSCSRFDRATGKLECKYCGYPFQRYQCVDYKCVDGCKTAARATGKKTQATWSAATDPNGRPLKFECCPIPDTIPRDGECLPNCGLLYRGEGYVQCGMECCPPGETCKIVQGKQKCVPCANTCRPQNGNAICCNKGEDCCFNDTTAACCGPKQTCKAAKVKQATCVCESGKKCGSDCCRKGETCLKDLSPGAAPSTFKCCPNDNLCGTDCCADGDFCLWKRDPDDLVPLGTKDPPVCKNGCARVNRCGTQCCGTGYRCNRRAKRCVPE